MSSIPERCHAMRLSLGCERRSCSPGQYLLFFYLRRFGARCESALAAAVLLLLLVRPSRITEDAAEAARELVFLPLPMFTSFQCVCQYAL